MGRATAKNWSGPWDHWEGSKGQISFNFNYKVNFKDFYTKLCVCSHKSKIQNILDGIFILSLGHAPGAGFGALGVSKGSKIHFSNMVMDKQNRMQVKFSSYGQTGDLGARSKGQVSFNFGYHVSYKDFMPIFVCVLTNKR